MEYYMCGCGKEFDNPQKFNGHKSGCRIHLGEEKYQQRLLRCKKGAERGSLQNSKLKQEIRIDKLNKWILEQHTCEVCNKIMTEKYGSGRFCCRICAKKRELSEDSKDKMRETVRNKAIEKYYLNSKKCVICNNIIAYGKKGKTCSLECHKKLASQVNQLAYLKYHAPKMNFKWGTYKGIHCDSSWELVYVMYNIDHNIAFSRNYDYFYYTDKNNKDHIYFPDFIQDNCYIELKNYETDLVNIKLAAVRDAGKQIKILYKKI